MQPYVVAGVYMPAVACAAVWDMRTRCIPNRLVLAAATILCAYYAGAASAGSVKWGRPVEAFVAAGVTFSIGYALKDASRKSFGGGDVKLLALTALAGGVYGVGVAAEMVAAGFVAAGLFSAVGVATRKLRLSDSVPFGPFVAVGSTVALLAGSHII